jgi:hypothetical protein
VATDGGCVSTIRQLSSPRSYDRRRQRESASAGGCHPRPIQPEPLCGASLRFIVAHGPGALHLEEGEAVGPNMFVSVTIRCGCGFEWALCVPVGLAVPAPLACNPGVPIAAPGVARSDICCPRCRFRLFPSDPALRSRVEYELRRGRGTHVRAGTVVIDCR